MYSKEDVAIRANIPVFIQVAGYNFLQGKKLNPETPKNISKLCQDISAITFT